VSVTRHLRIIGRVQGVFYRESMRMRAEALGVTGWVRNLRDGAVEAVIQGEENAIAELIAWCRIGPPAAAVSNVEISVAPGHFTSFERLSSA
jgi:acylphosphatase